MPERKQKYKLKIFVCLFLAYTCYTWNRKSVPFVLPVLITSGRLTKDVAGSITSFQNLAYAISKFVIGILSDHTSPRLLLIVGLLLSGLTAFIFPLFDHSSMVLVALWFCNGLLQGCGWPACSKIIQERYHPSLFGTLWSVLSCSTNVAGVISAAVSTYIVIHYDWRWSLFFAGGVSVAMSLVCSLAIAESRSPATGHQDSRKSKHDSTRKRNVGEKRSWMEPMMALRRYPLVGLVSFCYFMVFCAKTCCSDWAQAYLMEDHGFTQVTASIFVGSLEAGGLVGCLSAGYGSDRIVAKKERASDGSDRRILLAVAYMAGLSLALHLFCFHISDSKVALGILGLIFGICLYGPITIYGIVATKSVPEQLSGTSHAMAALSANVGGILAGFPVTSLAGHYGGWWMVFVVLEVFAIFTTLLMVFKSRLWLPNGPTSTNIKKGQ